MEIPGPDIVATEVPLDSLEGTPRSLVKAALSAGWTVKATRSLGPRMPRTSNQPAERVGTLALVGVAERVEGTWRFVAYWNARDGWDVVLARPGWGLAPSNTIELRDTFKAFSARQEA
jgi:hypothetical protein